MIRKLERTLYRYLYALNNPETNDDPSGDVYMVSTYNGSSNYDYNAVPVETDSSSTGSSDEEKNTPQSGAYNYRMRNLVSTTSHYDIAWNTVKYTPPQHPVKLLSSSSSGSGQSDTTTTTTTKTTSTPTQQCYPMGPVPPYTNLCGNKGPNGAYLATGLVIIGEGAIIVGTRGTILLVLPVDFGMVDGTGQMIAYDVDSGQQANAGGALSNFAQGFANGFFGFLADL